MESKLAVFLCTAPVVLVLLKQFFTPKPIAGIPHNPVRLLVGDIPSLIKWTTSGPATGNIAWFAHQHQVLNSPIVQIMLGPWRKMVTILDVQEIEDILRRGEEFPQAMHVRAAFGGTIPNGQVSLPTDGKWKFHRRVFGPSMTSKYLAQMTPRILENIEHLLEFWELKRKAVVEAGFPNACFPTSVDFQLATMDAIGDITFGQTFEGLTAAVQTVRTLGKPPSVDERGAANFAFVEVPPLFKAVRTLLQGIETATASISPSLSYFFIHRRATWKASHRLIYDIFDTKIKAAREKAELMHSLGEDLEQADCIMDIVTRREAKETAEKLSELELKDELLQYILAGQDTTAAALAWGLKYLSREPEVQRRLRDELRAALDTNDYRRPKYEEVQGDLTPYLDAVVMEILRCAAVAGGVAREVKEDTIILGHVIPKGTQLMLLTHDSSIQDNVANIDAHTSLNSVRSPTSLEAERVKGRWQDDGISFNPSRWIDENGRYNPRAGSVMPFGGGQRACFGQRLAVLELKLFVACLSLSFFFDRVPEELDSWRATDVIVRQPEHAFVSLKRWEDLVKQ